jgi:hypothetical protein
MWQHFWFKPNTLSPDVARSLRSPEIQIVKFVQKDQSGKFVEPQNTMKPGVILAGQKKEILKEIILSERQEAIILGNILGDGHLQLSPNGQKARLRFTHSMRQHEYVKWQYEQLAPLCKVRMFSLLQKFVKENIEHAVRILLIGQNFDLIMNQSIFRQALKNQNIEKQYRRNSSLH